MNKTDLMQFIIDKLHDQNKFEDYLLWFETIPDKTVTFHIMDNEYTIFTHISILQYLQNYVADDTYEYLDRLIYKNPDLNEFLTVSIDRKEDILYMTNEFYELFMDEATNYSVSTLK
jgi:hypothetical protein